MVATEQIGVGSVMPEFELPSIADGRAVRLSEYRGKKVILFMWASW